MALADDFYIEQRKANRRIAEALIAQSASTEPIQAHTQGLARIAQALVGGGMLGYERSQDQARDERISNLLAGLPGLAGTADASAAPGTAPAAGPAGTMYGSDFGGRAPDGMDRSISLGPRPPTAAPITMEPPEPSPYKIAGMAPPTNSQDTFRTPLDAMAPRQQGLAALTAAMGGAPPLTGATPPGAIPMPTQAIQPPAPAVPTAAAPAATGAPVPSAVPAVPATRASPQIDPANARYIRALMADPATRAYGMQLYSSLTAPTKFEKLNEDMLFDPKTGQLKETGLTYKPLTDPAERAKYGIPADDKRPYQVAPTGKLINPPAETRIAIDQRTESKFREKAGGLTAERFNDYIKSGDEARGMVADLDSLREIGSRVTTGKTAEIKAALGPYAEALGVKIDQLGDLQAYNAITAKMAPRMRVPGSGATSDFEMRQYLEALPTLGKTPEGNEIIANTNQMLLKHRQAVSEIASRAMQEELTPREAEKMIRELPDPMAMWKKARGASPAASPGSGRTQSGIQWSVE
jgi:hypothetical protein